MKCARIWVLVILAALILNRPSAAFGQGAFKIPFKFKAAGLNLPAGEYWVEEAGEGQLMLRQLSTGKEARVPYAEKLTPPTEPVAELRLVFDEVGDFAPSYTEYFTVYVLAEVWLSEKDGYLVHITKGAHQHKTVTGVKAEK